MTNHNDKVNSVEFWEDYYKPYSNSKLSELVKHYKSEITRYQTTIQALENLQAERAKNTTRMALGDSDLTQVEQS